MQGLRSGEKMRESESECSCVEEEEGRDEVEMEA